MTYRRRVIILALLAVSLPRLAWAADKESVPSKTYRNDTFKFSIGYGEDEQIITSTQSGQGFEEFHQVDFSALVGPRNQPGYYFSITVGHGGTEQECNFPFDYYRTNRTSNGFFMADPVKVGISGHTTYYGYRLFHDGYCFALGSFGTNRKKIVESFRFLDREPASPAGGTKANP